MAKIIQAPEPLSIDADTPSVFLAGSIEEGEAEHWQSQLVRLLNDTQCSVFNPRRDDWDDRWEQSADNEEFRRQVEWEFKAMEAANVIAMVFAPTTRSPVTLLELGLYARSKKLVVCCPDGFWRKGHVDLVCERFHVPTVAGLEEMARWIRRRFAGRRK